MSELFGFFTLIGLVIVIFAVVFGVTWLTSKVTGDDHDCAMRWFMTCLLYAITTAIFVLHLHLNG
jgi:cytochrome bd-type quinol oxidase subunit 2